MKDHALPDLLVTLAWELRRKVAKLVPELAGSALDGLIGDMMSCAHGAWGNEVPVASHVSDITHLPDADPVYRLLYDSWDAVLGARVERPQAWRHIAVCQLLDVARGIVGGFYVPKGSPQRALRDQLMYDSFRGSYREIAIKHGLTDRRARQIIDRMRQQAQKNRQLDLFD